MLTVSELDALSPAAQRVMFAYAVTTLDTIKVAITSDAVKGEQLDALRKWAASACDLLELLYFARKPLIDVAWRWDDWAATLDQLNEAAE